MSQDNVRAFERGIDAINRRDIEALIEELHPDVEWHDVFGLMLGGEARMYRGHDGVRELFRDLYDAFAETNSEYSDIRDSGDRIVAIGLLRVRGNESGAVTESELGTICRFENGKVTFVRTFLDSGETLEAAGLPE